MTKEYDRHNRNRNIYIFSYLILTEGILIYLYGLPSNDIFIELLIQFFFCINFIAGMYVFFNESIIVCCQTDWYVQEFRQCK